MSLPAVFNAISIHSLRMEGDPSYSEIYDGYSISIHSLRMEGDSGYCKWACCHRCISIHSLRMEGDTGRDFRIIVIVIFQSTPSAWRETCKDLTIYNVTTHFNPLPPHGGRPLSQTRNSTISNHFNPLPPHGGRLCAVSEYRFRLAISIHSLRMEGDSKTAQESVFHFAYPCTILQKRMQKTTFCTRKNDFFRKKGEKFGAKPPASFCAPMIRTDIFPQTSLTESAALPCLWFPLHRYVPPSTDNDFPGNKTAGCPFLYQSPVPADA